MQNVNVIWKVAAASLALVPGLYSIVFFMVEAKTENIQARLVHLEKENNKGPRFTKHDGNLLNEKIGLVEKHHYTEMLGVRDALDKIRFDDATCKANMGALTMRLVRVEDRVYATDVHPESQNFRNAPYRMPIMPYDEELWPAMFRKDFQ